jgi:hypothetical protein
MDVPRERENGDLQFDPAAERAVLAALRRSLEAAQRDGGAEDADDERRRPG